MRSASAKVDGRRLTVRGALPLMTNLGAAAAAEVAQDEEVAAAAVAGRPSDRETSQMAAFFTQSRELARSVWSPHIHTNIDIS